MARFNGASKCAPVTETALSFDARTLRHALSHFTTGVTVVTAAGADSGPLGITVNSFNSVSLDPPLILFSVGKHCLSLPALERAGAFAVNVLRDDQHLLSRRFATAMCDKWCEVAYRPGVTGSPLLESALAVFECEPYARHAAGDHEIFIGRVVSLATAEGQPLVFYRGAYGAFSPVVAGLS